MSVKQKEAQRSCFSLLQVKETILPYCSFNPNLLLITFNYDLCNLKL